MDEQEVKQRDVDNAQEEEEVEESETLRLLREKWTKEQDDLCAQLIQQDDDDGFDIDNLTLIGGVDISFVKDSASNEAVAALVVMSYPALEIVYERYERVDLDVPYIPGFLAFREVPHLQRLLEETRGTPHFPQVVMVDGNGILHPRGFGLACHLGVLCNIPCIGVAKNLHCVDGLTREHIKKRAPDTLHAAGDSFELIGDSGRVWGAALRSTKKSSVPIYVSAGHRMTLTTALKLVQSCCRYRVPEPVRAADLGSREVIRQYENNDNTTTTTTTTTQVS